MLYLALNDIKSPGNFLPSQLLSNSDGRTVKSVNWDEFLYIVSFIESTNEKKIVLTGGEPLAHPNIIEYILFLRHKGFEITVITSGEENIEKIQELYKEIGSFKSPELKFSLIISDVSLTEKYLSENEFLKQFGSLVTLHIRADNLNQPMDSLIRLILRYNLCKTINISFPHPVHGNTIPESYPEQLKVYISDILKNETILNKFCIDLEFGCGLPFSLLSDSDFSKLYKLTSGKIEFKCNPYLLITPDMEVMYCGMLNSAGKKDFYEFNSVQQVKHHYSKLQERIRNEMSGIFLECDTCQQQQKNICYGGCLSYIISILKSNRSQKLNEIFNHVF